MDTLKTVNHLDFVRESLGVDWYVFIQALVELGPDFLHKHVALAYVSNASPNDFPYMSEFWPFISSSGYRIIREKIKNK